MIWKSIKEKIKKIEGKLILNVFSKYDFENNDVDFISIIIKYMKSIYNMELINNLIIFEKNNILWTKLLCSDEFKNDYFEKIY